MVIFCLFDLLDHLGQAKCDHPSHSRSCYQAKVRYHVAMQVKSTGKKCALSSLTVAIRYTSRETGLGAPSLDIACQIREPPMCIPSKFRLHKEFQSYWFFVLSSSNTGPSISQNIHGTTRVHTYSVEQIEAELRPRSAQRYQTAIMITWRRERDAGLAIMPICVFTPMIQVFSRCSHRHSDRAPPQEMMS